MNDSLNLRDYMRFQRKSIRLPGYDYSRPGWYFVTVCVNGSINLLGKIENNIMKPNTYGKIVIHFWQWLEKHYPNVVLDQWIVMPNHLHGIIIIKHEECRGGSRTAPTQNEVKPKPLGRFIGAFKTASTKHINQIRGTPGTQ